MKVGLICGALALAAAACTHTTDQTIAQVDGDSHVIVRAEAGHLWWAHHAWTEPHELWSLPSKGRVDNLTVTPEKTGFAVSFEQGGTTWQGSFGPSTPASHTVTELAQREP